MIVDMYKISETKIDRFFILDGSQREYPIELKSEVFDLIKKKNDKIILKTQQEISKDEVFETHSYVVNDRNSNRIYLQDSINYEKIASCSD